MGGGGRTQGPRRRRGALGHWAVYGIGKRQRWLLVAVFAAVVGTDQAVKWWAWRHLDGTLINSGGYVLLGPVVRSWYAGPVSGAFLDILGGLVLILSVRLLLRARRMGVLIGGGLMAAGWVSNLADRLAVHYWTAPGSMRGVVDFIPSGGASRCNVADLWIVAGALLLANTVAQFRSADRPLKTIGSGTDLHPAGVHRTDGRLAALIAVLAVVTLAVLGAVNHGGVDVPAGVAGG